MACICTRSPISIEDDSHGTKVARLRLCDSPLSGLLGASGLYRDWPLPVLEVDDEDEDEVSSLGKCWRERLSPILGVCVPGAVSRNN
jgi:hypothetical protein